MEEKILIKSEQYVTKKLLRICVIIAIVLVLYLIVVNISYFVNDMNYYSEHKHDKYCYDIFYRDDFEEDYRNNTLQVDKMDCFQMDYRNAFAYASRDISYVLVSFFLNCLLLSAVPILFGVLLYFLFHSYELTVTNKRIFGKIILGKRVDLPVDSISAISTIAIFRGVSVSTSSGKISFLMLKNAADIYTVMNNLLIERQQAKSVAAPISAAPATDSADLLKKYKELLDSGAITKEEFETKKKQLLGL